MLGKGAQANRASRNTMRTSAQASALTATELTHSPNQHFGDWKIAKMEKNGEKWGEMEQNGENVGNGEK